MRAISLMGALLAAIILFSMPASGTLLLAFSLLYWVCGHRVLTRAREGT
jgi:hypothetical protein